jgi:hypothetical protein
MTPAVRLRAAVAFLAAAAALHAVPAAAQVVRAGPVSTGVQLQGYDFDNALGVEAVNLVLLPVAWSVGLGERTSFDVYSAFARGAALIGGTEYVLRGATDTRLRANFAATPWAVVTMGLNLPTGRTGHSAGEARVAAVLGTDLLGFREANFGLGFGATTGIATAHRVGDTGLGAGLSYRVAGGFEPSADTAFTYTPGNELRIRAGIDQNIGRNRLTAGVTYQNFATDRVDGRELFQPGGRWRGDVAYAFRTSPAASWTVYVTDVWRDHGDVRFARLDPADADAGPLRIGTQNLLIGGIAGAWRATPALLLQPMAEGRLLSREDRGGDGWLLGFGSGLPLRTSTVNFSPTARVNFGGMQDDDGVSRRIIGAELAVTASFGGR